MQYFWSYSWSILLILVSFFLIIIILLQRGRGGGLAGAFGGLGGQSAFGTKAGDVFTKITIGLAVIWVALAGLCGASMVRESKNYFEGDDEPTKVQIIGSGDIESDEDDESGSDLGNLFEEPEKSSDSEKKKSSPDEDLKAGSKEKSTTVPETKDAETKVDETKDAEAKEAEKKDDGKQE